ncbi:hypothetical protein HRR83_001335 [Exophiala dermatitidis]|uniref:Uncharacterized protein n=2 Tax=Exophiala dermatitidis TaxID=5970 RepID=H6C6P2_EXODN|nr:uncharacterized protein HMPREF1120_07378 [Exophiala dermatitidis NIH/UT8656]KAJ4526146.1 hypothetical protein HRR74_001339 [Exophiala dermatitidis]EHY59388.1 hypothetical protein HMPREF1120_07378 [Exophiala dermatitidis NIH/UT8656]KAJ4526909.1 hypothetical protein HRR73_001706 [Exophiala dermatitidis]KAJ4532621.1 hypothetical protein HRR76_007608 [Exophiala dermatitidis]KAJ4559804.1 hypothetical protein HRR78_000324 [Exophiala dermatitidis]
MSAGRPKAFLKQAKGKKKKEQILESADDFLAAGVEFEEAAGKWRAGDAAKSMRFFSKAIDVYDQGLAKFPQSLDLAYNKARVLLEIATHPILIGQLNVPLVEVLQQALNAHRYALSLDQDNTETLFNTAQVLTAIAEAYANDSDRADHEALQPLEEALELQDRCLNLQEIKLEESLLEQREAEALFEAENSEPLPAEANTQVSEDTNNSPRNGTEDQWFAVVEPLTKDTLIDTIVAELGTLTTLCSIISSSPGAAPPSILGWIEEFSTKLLQTKLPPLLQDAEIERQQEVALAKANFSSALLEAGYRSGAIDASTYKRERDEAFRAPELGIEKNFAALLANTNSLIAFNAALAEGDASGDASQASLRWNALSAAIASMATASKISTSVPDDIAETHFLRGNCSLLQHRLSQPPISFQPAVANAAQLLKNADVFYRNAAKLYQNDEQKAVSQLRAAVPQALQMGQDILSVSSANVQGRDRAWIVSQLEEMADEGLISVPSNST